MIVVMGNVRNQGRKSARKKRPQEVIEEEKENKRIDMMNQRLSLEINPNQIIEDTTVHLINPPQEKMKHSLEGLSISTIVVEEAPHGSIQEAKRRCSWGDVLISTSSQSDKLPSQDEAHEEALDMDPTVEEALDMEPTVEEVLDMEPTVEEENIIRTIDEDVGLPPSNYQEENEWQQVATEMQSVFLMR